MKIEQIGLLTTLILGIFIIIGALIAFIMKKREKVIDFSLGLAFGVIIMLMIADLLPEIIEQLGLKYIYLFIIYTALGYFLLKFLDNFIPDHEETKMNKKDLKNNLIHIGVVTSLALFLHNIIEGMAVYSTVLTDKNLGVAMSLGIGFHNIPLGMVIATTLYQSSTNMSKTVLGILAVSLSTFAGGLILFFLNLHAISSIILGSLLSTTLGMLIFIALDELLPRIKMSKNDKVTYVGITLGIIILLIATII